MQRIQKNVGNGLDRSAQEIENIEKEIKEIHEYLTNLYKDKVKKILTDDEYMRMSLEFKEQKDNLMKRRETLIEKQSGRRGRRPLQCRKNQKNSARIPIYGKSYKRPN